MQTTKETVYVTTVQVCVCVCVAHTDVKLLDVTIILRSNNMLRKKNINYNVFVYSMHSLGKEA